jgi:hypothetical protein
MHLPVNSAALHNFIHFIIRLFDVKILELNLIYFERNENLIIFSLIYIDEDTQQ